MSGCHPEELQPRRPARNGPLGMTGTYTLSGMAYGARYGRVRSALASGSPTIVSVFPSNFSCRPTR